MQVFAELKHSIDEYVNVIQAEKTKRAKMGTQAAIAVAHIDAQKEVLLDYLRLAHDSRADFFEKSFASLDGALEKGQVGTVSEILDSITEVAKKSPFADLKDVGGVKPLWDDPDAEIEV